MNRLKSFIAVVVALGVVFGAMAPPAQAQTAVTMTALASALNVTNNTLNVVSATGFSPSTSTQTYYVYIDREAMEIRAVSGTSITVRRGQLRTNQTSHRSGTLAVVGLAERFISQDPSPGSCVRATDQIFTPLINISTGTWWDCSLVMNPNTQTAGQPTSGVWQGVNLMEVAFGVPYKNPGNASYTALYTDWFIDYNSMTAARTVTLPAVTALYGKIYVIKNSQTAPSGNVLTVAASVGQFVLTVGTASTTVTDSGVLRLISVGGGYTSW